VTSFTLSFSHRPICNNSLDSTPNTRNTYLYTINSHSLRDLCPCSGVYYFVFVLPMILTGKKNVTHMYCSQRRTNSYVRKVQNCGTGSRITKYLIVLITIFITTSERESTLYCDINMANVYTLIVCHNFRQNRDRYAVTNIDRVKIKSKLHASSYE